MNAKRESNCWWFNTHNASNSSPWLESTLQELNEKTKTMLKLVEDDADSFAQRAEMYYKKRPELVSMVEDFYRAYRSLAERYDQLKSNRSVNIKSPLRDLVSRPKGDSEDGLNSIESVKSFDCFTEVCYSSGDESPESEVDDPELDDDSQIELVNENPLSTLSGNCELDRLQGVNEIQKNQLAEKINDFEKQSEKFDTIKEENAMFGEVKKPLSGLSCNCELTTLRKELDRLREVNEIQKNQLAEKISELENLREEFDAIKEENASKTVKCDVKSLKLYDMDQTEQKYVKKDEEKNDEMIKSWDEIQNLGLERMKQREIVKQEFLKIEAENTSLKEALSLKQMLLEQESEEKNNVTRLFVEAKTELDKAREETQRKEQCLIEGDEIQNLGLERMKQREIVKQEFLKIEAENTSLKEALSLKQMLLEQESEEKNNVTRLFEEAKTELDKVREETQRKDQCLIEALEEKDEEKRAVIRQLSLAMEVLREDNLFLKKAIITDSSKKTNAFQFQMFKGVQVSKWFNSSSKRNACFV